MAKNKTINVKGIQVAILSEDNKDEYISLTDIARYRDSERSDYILQTGCEQEALLNLLDCGSNSITPILIPSNSMELKIRQEQTVFHSHLKGG
jgi:hypothetical protein